jgi:hypothetical protein
MKPKGPKTEAKTKVKKSGKMKDNKKTKQKNGGKTIKNLKQKSEKMVNKNKNNRCYCIIVGENIGVCAAYIGIIGQWDTQGIQKN